MRLAYRRVLVSRLMASTCERPGGCRIGQAEAFLPYVIQVLQSLVVLMFAPLYAGVITRAEALVGSSSNVVLQIPGADPSSPLGRSQAIELLRRYLRPAEERGLDVTAIREVEPGKGFVELTRRYVVAGTTELRHETLFLGYRLQGRDWRLVELRSAP